MPIFCKDFFGDDVNIFGSWKVYFIHSKLNHIKKNTFPLKTFQLPFYSMFKLDKIQDYGKENK